jgi:anti-anti-sigma factor
VSTIVFLDVTVVPDRAVVRVRASGEADLSTRDVLDARLRELWDCGWEDVVVDLREVTFMDSSGVHVLLAHHRHAAEHGHRFSVIDGSDAVRRVLELTGVDRVLDGVVAERA